MERVYVRFAPGTSLEDASREDRRDGGDAEGEASAGERGAGAHQRRRRRARRASAMNSPNMGTAHGLHPRRAHGPGEALELDQREIADRMREILRARVPRRGVPAGPGGLVASVFSNGYIAPLVVEVRGDNLETMLEQSKAVAEVARTVPGIRDVYVRSRERLPRDPGRRPTARRPASSASPRAMPPRRRSRRRCGNINTPGRVDRLAATGSPTTWSRTTTSAVVKDTTALGAGPRACRAERRGGDAGRLRQDPALASGPVAVERNQLERVRPRPDADRGARHRQRGGRAREAARRRPPDQGHQVRFVGQVELMRTTFSGLGVALGLAVMVVFMIMATQFKSLRPAVRHALHHPGVARGHRRCADGGRTGLLDHRADGRADGHRHRRVERHPAGRPRQPQPASGMASRSRPSSTRRALRFTPIAMTSLATIIGLLPDGAWPRARRRAQSPARARGGRRAHVVDAAVAVPRPDDVRLLRAAACGRR